MLRRAVLLVAPALLALACGSQPAKSSSPPPHVWRVSGGFVRAPDGRTAFLRGVNLAGAHKFAPYFGFQQPPDYAAVRSVWGMNTIRFLIIWAAIEPKKGQYDQSYLDQVVKRIGWARDAGLHVVLDMHQDVYGEGFSGGDGAPAWTCDQKYYNAFVPKTPWALDYLDPNVEACFDQFWASDELQSHYAEAWRQVALRLKDNDAVVGFDVMNEPSFGSAVASGFGAAKLEPFYEKVVPVVRSVAPHWLAFLEPSAARNIGVRTSLTKFPFKDVVYAPHSYNASAEQGNGFNPNDRGALINNVAALAGEATDLDAALWIGEYGGIATDPGITPYMDANYDGAAAVLAANTYWSYDEGGGYSMLDANGTPHSALLDVLVRPFPEMVAGDPVAISYDDSTRTFTFKWHADRSISEPTVLSVPAHAYPSGYKVQCGGCKSHQDKGELYIDTPPSGDPASVVITP